MDFFGEGGVAAATTVVPLTDRHSVTIGLLTAEQEDECEAILQGGAPKTRLVQRPGQPGQGAAALEQVTELSLQMRQYREAYLLAAIRSWNLTEAGQVAPIDLPHVRALPEKYRNLLFVKAKEFNAPLSPESQGK